MRHERHYTLEEANAALPEVTDLIGSLRAARDRLGDRDARDALAEATPTNGGGEPARTVAEGFLGVREGLLHLQDKEIVLRDLDRGLVDFPAIRDGTEVYLCWEEGEEKIAYWHEPDAGFAGRQPLDG